MVARMWVWPEYTLEVDGRKAFLTKLEGSIVARLFRTVGQYVSTEDLIDAAYFDDVDGGPLCAANTISVTCCRINRKLKRIGASLDRKRARSQRRLIVPGVPDAIWYREADLFASRSTERPSAYRYTRHP